ncbi:anaphase-promoting complex subunit 4 [Platysternon megacephalum]|uniref:Anaphase-promoting complex subunit 4 n=1 Tax=Platysternon megacephalum TaxID=55544 RepID=A0A4D9F0G2_9SAUR|nr:anaphase-promoting complex subunit 4 [Platysternon megacephalum]
MTPLGGRLGPRSVFPYTLFREGARGWSAPSFPTQELAGKEQVPLQCIGIVIFIICTATSHFQSTLDISWKPEANQLPLATTITVIEIHILMHMHSTKHSEANTEKMHVIC